MRYTAGFRGENGVGLRGRFWSFDHNYPFNAAFAPAQLGIDASTADAEVTAAQRFLNWDVEFSGGVRYGSSNTQRPSPVRLESVCSRLKAFGPTAGIDVQRRFGDTGLSLVGRARGSWLFGDIRNGSVLLFVPRGSIEEEVMQIYEASSACWQSTLADNIALELRAAWESQVWLNSTLSDDFFGIGTNLAFFGPAISAQLRY